MSADKHIKTMGIVGGGQLGQMIAAAATKLGIKSVVWDPDINCPASQNCWKHITATYDNNDACAELISLCDAITVEFENIPLETVKQLNEKKPVFPTADTLNIARNRALEKASITAAGLKTANYVLLKSGTKLDTSLNIGFPGILKTCRLGYDGKGQVKVAKASDLAAAWQQLNNVDCVYEELVNFKREISVICARNVAGDIVSFPAVENIHEDGILRKTIAPCKDAPIEATKIAEHLAHSLNSIGLLAVEMFDTDMGIIINEIAPRPHNSGHWSIEGCATSQFEQLLRVIFALPLGSTKPLGEFEMINLLGDEILQQHWLNDEKASFHHYGKKDIKPHRKMGHVTRKL